MAIRHRIVYPLVFAFMFLGLIVSGVGTASASTSKDIATTPDHPDCDFYEGWFWLHSQAAGEADNTEDATYHTQMASYSIDQARSLNCSWPNEVFPPDPPCGWLFCSFRK